MYLVCKSGRTLSKLIYGAGLAAWRKKDKYMGITLGSSVLGGSQTEISQDYLMQNALSEFRKAASLGSSTALQSS